MPLTISFVSLVGTSRRWINLHWFGTCSQILQFNCSEAGDTHARGRLIFSILAIRASPEINYNSSVAHRHRETEVQVHQIKFKFSTDSDDETYLWFPIKQNIVRFELWITSNKLNISTVYPHYHALLLRWCIVPRQLVVSPHNYNFLHSHYLFRFFFRFSYLRMPETQIDRKVGFAIHIRTQKEKKREREYRFSTQTSCSVRVVYTVHVCVWCITTADHRNCNNSQFPCR